MTLFQAFGQFAGQAAVDLEALQIITPSSITFTGTDASINSNGGVDFDAATRIVINDVFSADYTNYVCVHNYTPSGTSFARVQYITAAGSILNGSTYVNSYTTGDGSSITSAGSGTATTFASYGYANSYSSFSWTEILNPYSAQPTTSKSYCTKGENKSGLQILWHFNYEESSSSIAGIRWEPSVATTGNLAIYGYVGS